MTALRNLAFLALTMLLSGAAPAAGPRRSYEQLCGLNPADWCASPAGDPCGVHRDEKSCRADSRCRGLPYRGESVVACNPDGKGFWSNCPAVGCVSRSDPPGKPPRAEVVKALCGDPTFGGKGAEIQVWRTAAHETTVLAFRRTRPAIEIFYDAQGRRLLSVTTGEAVPRGSDLGRHQAELRALVLSGLTEAETVPCGSSMR